jgi:LPPG:FO 2-phospho-L-lactate transferase
VPVVALAGGVGAARFLRGLTRAIPAEQVTAIVNTGDDKSFYGVHVSPDLDIVTYTLAGRIEPTRGWGLAGDRFELIETLARLGHDTWFRLGDLDYAICLHRTLRLREGAGLATVADELRRFFGVATKLLPMSEDPCPTLVSRRGGKKVHFEEYLVRDGAPDDVVGVDLSAAGRAKPAPGVLESLRAASAIVLCPSNPVVSIGPPPTGCCAASASKSRRAAWASSIAKRRRPSCSISGMPRSSPICARSGCAPASPTPSCATMRMPPGSP